MVQTPFLSWRPEMSTPAMAPGANGFEPPYSPLIGHPRWVQVGLETPSLDQDNLFLFWGIDFTAFTSLITYKSLDSSPGQGWTTHGVFLGGCLQRPSLSSSCCTMPGCPAVFSANGTVNHPPLGRQTAFHLPEREGHPSSVIYKTSYL